MGKVILGAIVGSLIGAVAILFIAPAGDHDQGPYGDAWPAILRAQLETASPLEDEGLSTLVALAEELYWLRRAEMDQQHGLTSFVRQPGKSSKADADDESRALGFLIERVTASLSLELDRWQGQMERIHALGGPQRDAALRILAFAKWQQKGGAYDYAYDFFNQLTSTSAAPVERTAAPTVVPTVPPTATLRPTRPPRPRVVQTPAATPEPR